ncbi:alpha/beta fold hydrolase [Hydrogenophaga pseudoflava]|uniref:alpha/beta fold hydrolase n=1 Tax=Hydrogenophaga pseudoflava TaxID=47421 RepID=UPI0027E4D299|nr:alpha/beta fold hydrolase [Hydrogenophaga pseudoflava]MDQ7745616.1 alpha/beta fold hydrolase [Hydrogenophaga pseudoflava]
MTADLPALLQSKPHPMISKNDATAQAPWRRQCDLGLAAPHRMAWHLGGNPEGDPWLLLHGGPGSGANAGLLAPLDLSRHRAIAPDQRGSGASRPRGSTLRNHTAALVSDLESLRRHLGLERWSLLAGSWGTVLALAYAQAHPQRVQRLVLRGAFALSRREIGDLLQGRASGKTLSAPRAFWPVSRGVALSALLARLRQLLQTGTPAVAALRAARRWALLESRAAARGQWRALLGVEGAEAAGLRAVWAGQRRRERRLSAGFRHRGDRIDPTDRALLRKFRIQSHYLLRRGFVRPGGLDCAVRAVALAGVPVDWVHGAFDAVCPPQNSRRWQAQMARLAPGRSSLTLTRAGHLGHEPRTLAALREKVRRS